MSDLQRPNPPSADYQPRQLDNEDTTDARMHTQLTTDVIPVIAPLCTKEAGKV